MTLHALTHKYLSVNSQPQAIHVAPQRFLQNRQVVGVEAGGVVFSMFGSEGLTLVQVEDIICISN